MKIKEIAKICLKCVKHNMNLKKLIVHETVKFHIYFATCDLCKNLDTVIESGRVSERNIEIEPCVIDDIQIPEEVNVFEPQKDIDPLS